MVVVRGFVKGDRRTPRLDLRLARHRKGKWAVRKVTSDANNPHLGTTLDDLLAEDGLLDHTSRVAASRVSAWQKDRFSRSLWQLAQSGYDIFVSKQGGPMMLVTDENACVLRVRATASRAGRVYVDFEPRERSDLYVIYSAASDPDQRPQELCIRRRGAGGDTVYVNGLGHIDCRSPEPGHAIRLGGVGDARCASGDGHAIRYDGQGELPSGECHDLIGRHLARIAEVSAAAPAFEPAHDRRGDRP